MKQYDISLIFQINSLRDIDSREFRLETLTEK